MFLYKMLKKIFPKNIREKNTEPELHESTQKAKLAVERYQDTSHAVQKEIKRNHFAKYLVYTNENYTDQGEEEKHETK